MKAVVDSKTESLVILGSETEIYAFQSWLSKHTIRLAQDNLERMLTKGSGFVPTDKISTRVIGED